MAGYAKHNFEDGQVLHAQALNEMDDAIGEVKSDLLRYITYETNESSTISIEANSKFEASVIVNQKSGYVPFLHLFRTFDGSSYAFCTNPCTIIENQTTFVIEVRNVSSTRISGKIKGVVLYKRV